MMGPQAVPSPGAPARTRRPDGGARHAGVRVRRPRGRRRRAHRHPDHAPRGGAHTHLHARGHPGQREDALPGRGGGDRSPHRAGQHLPPVAAPRPRGGRPRRWPARVHALAALHAHRLGGLPGVLPGRAPLRRAGRLRLPLAPQREKRALSPEVAMEVQGALGRRHRHAARRVPARGGSAARRRGRLSHHHRPGPGGAWRPRLRARPSSASSREAPTPISAAPTPTSWARCPSTASPSAGSAWGSPSSACTRWSARSPRRWTPPVLAT